MEINITRFVTEVCPRDYSASVAEIGNDAGPATWRAACDDSEDWSFVDTDDKRDEFRRYVKGFGAWEPEEIDAWSDTELNALCIQFIAGSIREAGIVPNMTPEAWARGVITTIERRKLADIL